MSRGFSWESAVPGIARPSVASLFLRMRFNDTTLATGTGFVVEPSGQRLSLLVTNRHNLSGRRSDDNSLMSTQGAIPNVVDVVHNLDGQLGVWESRSEPLRDHEDRPLWYEHPGLGFRGDVVALPLTQLDNVAVYPHDPWSTTPDVSVAVSDSVQIIGFPFGLTGGGAFGVWSRGSIATEPDINHGDLPCFLIDSRSRIGQSGSPVIYYSNGGGVNMADGSLAMFTGPVERLLGVYSGRIHPESDLGRVWKAEMVRQVIDARHRPDQVWARIAYWAERPWIPGPTVLFGQMS